MDVFYHQKQLMYQPLDEFDGNRMKKYSEGNWRIKLVKESLERSMNDFIFKEPILCKLEDIYATHDRNYIDFLSNIPKNQVDTSPIAFSYPNSRINPKSTSSFFSNIGYYFFDPATPVNGQSFDSAHASASTALGSIDSLKKDGRVICLTRPPGHHAMKAVGGGYCFFNNVAILAQKLSDMNKSVSIFDIDFHHGNGTQEIFYTTDKVQYVSIHGDPTQFYPFYWGSTQERGEGDGFGFNINYPMPKSTANSQYDQVLDQALRDITDYDPDFLLISLGLDCYKGDLVGGMELSQEYYKTIGKKVSKFSNIAILLEGGYHNEIGTCFRNVCENIG